MSSSREQRIRKLNETLRKKNLVMGVLNVTPDSFSDGGLYFSKDRALNRAEEMLQEGADLIDVGGESSRPGSDPVPVDVQISRVVPVIEGIRGSSEIPISIDTQDETVARAALEAGADIVNDISAFRASPGMPEVIRAQDAGVILMHMRGTPKTMQLETHYEDVVSDVLEFLKNRVEQAIGAGVRKEFIWIDPGIGFGKSVEGNLRLLRSIGRFDGLGHPVVIGVSRKSFIGNLLNREVNERLAGTLGVIGWLAASGNHRIHRVHDVKPVSDCLRMVESIRGNNLCD